MQQLFYTFLVVLPLLFLPLANQQFELPKFTLTLVMAGLCLLFWAYEYLRNKQTAISGKGITLAGALLLGFLTLHSIFVSIIPDNSIWGNYQRHTGLLLWIALGILFVTTVKRSLTPARQQNILRLIAITGIIAAWIAVLQWLSPDLWGGLASTTGRVYGTLGIPNFLGQWLLLTLTLTFYQCSIAGKLRLLWGTGALLQLLALILTGNRASLLVFGLLCLVMALIMLFRMRRTWQKAALSGALLVALLAVGYGIFTRTDGAFRSLESRALLYPTAVQALAERPAFGYGLDTLYTVFAQRMPPNLGASENLVDVPDKVHHVILDVLLETGPIGFLLFLWLCIEVVLQGHRLLKNEDRLVREQSAAILLALCVWFLSLFVSFPGIAERVYAIVLLGLLVAQGGETHGALMTTWRRYAYAVLSIMGAVVLLILGIGTAIADAQYAKIGSSPLNNPLAEVLMWTPMRMEYEVFGNNTSPQVSPEYDVQHLRSALHKNPADVWAWNFLAEAYQSLGNTKESQDALTQAQKACPRCSFVYVQGARLAKARGDIAAAQVWAEGYMQLLPAFMTADPTTLTSDAKERRRITLKEQKTDLGFILGLLPESSYMPLRAGLR